MKSSWAHMGNHLKQKLDIQSKETGNCRATEEATISPVSSFNESTLLVLSDQTSPDSWSRTSPHGSTRFPSPHFYSEAHLLLLKLLTNVPAALKSALHNFLKTLKVSSAAGSL